MASAGRAPRFGLWRVAYSVVALLACRAPGDFCRSNWDHPALFSILVSAVVRTAYVARMRFAKREHPTRLPAVFSLRGTEVRASLLGRFVSVRQAPPFRRAPCRRAAVLCGYRSCLAQPRPSYYARFLHSRLISRLILSQVSHFLFLQQPKANSKTNSSGLLRLFLLFCSALPCLAWPCLCLVRAYCRAQAPAPLSRRNSWKAVSLHACMHQRAFDRRLYRIDLFFMVFDALDGPFSTLTTAAALSVLLQAYNPIRQCLLACLRTAPPSAM